jgi:hypothetical protein
LSIESIYGLDVDKRTGLIHLHNFNLHHHKTIEHVSKKTFQGYSSLADLKNYLESKSGLITLTSHYSSFNQKEISLLQEINCNVVFLSNSKHEIIKTFDHIKKEYGIFTKHDPKPFKEIIHIYWSGLYCIMLISKELYYY